MLPLPLTLLWPDTSLERARMHMSLQQHCQSIANTITDYAPNGFGAPNPDHVERWSQAFDPAVRTDVVAELDHLLAQTYYSRQRVIVWLRAMARTPDWVGPNPAGFWSSVNILDIQTDGNSQRDFAALLTQIVRDDFGVDMGAAAIPASPYLYIDDFLFSGGRIKNDLCGWIVHHAPPTARLIVCTIGVHRYGQWSTENALNAKADEVGKRIAIEWWNDVEVEDRQRYVDSSDVLRPTGSPGDARTDEYLATIRPTWRTGHQVGSHHLFSSGAARDLLERQFLKEGVEVRRRCPNFDPYMRPLGRQMFANMGFGTMYVTWRNCPNNAPLVLWAGNPWYPLFRRTNN